ncbi:hypothetical protein AMK26_27465 [Streptomyces sp. CB03234]|uniref:hypothetical protein n=1 Tax=Streptomyces sp. (strain CB03234) TaxID=1703937 RepID=UPI00093A15E1|nr:hypothetical protein [Streptomyces sp. CB03234]OKJ99738.1 hypothetical protein AMK26_27465 [Streptomyces sp. CB03234]
MSSTALRAFTRPALAALCAAAALGLTACGPFGSSGGVEESGPFAGLSGPQIANKAIKATKTADSLTLDANLQMSDGPVKAFMALDTKGQCAGTISMGPTGTAELIRTGKVAYMRFDEAFLREQNKGGSPEETEAVLKMLKGRWVKTDVTDPEAKDSLEMCELDTMLAEFETGINSAQRGEETTVNGKKALILTEKDGDATYKIYVATEGEPYLLKIEQKGGEEPGTMSFLDYNKPVPAKQPAAKDILDLKELGEQ